MRGRRAVAAVASMVAVGFTGSVIVSPLYPLYQRKFGFSEVTLTLIYATYVVGNVAALLLLGQVSDQVGRKRISLPTLALAVVSALVFVFAAGSAWLFAGRLLFGLAVGILSGTGTAWLAEQHGEEGRARATLTAVAANLSGIAIGPLLGGLLGQYAPSPLELPFLVYVALVAAVAVAIARTPETREPTVAGLGELRVRVRLGVPRESLAAFATPAVTGFVIFSLAGLYFALIPSILAHDLHRPNLALGGATICELGVFGVLCVLVARAWRASHVVVGGLVLLLPAVGLLVLAQAARSLPLLLVATALAGVALALGYRGGLETVNRIGPDEHRAEIVSSYLVCCFVGNSVPVIGIGVLGSVAAPLTATVVFACAVAFLSCAALAWRAAPLVRSSGASRSRC